MIGLIVFVLPILLAVPIAIALGKVACLLGVGSVPFAILKLLTLTGVVLLSVGFAVAFFFFNPTDFIVGRALTFQDHFSYAKWNAGIMALLVVPASLLAFKAGKDAAKGNPRNET